MAASIRIVNPQSMKKEDFIRGGTATDEMLDFLSECIRYGISVCVAGATSSGKTTLLGWLLTTIPDSKRIYSIENGSRELALVRRKDGKVVNSVIHTLTRDSENERQRVTRLPFWTWRFGLTRTLLWLARCVGRKRMRPRRQPVPVWRW